MIKIGKTSFDPQAMAGITLTEFRKRFGKPVHQISFASAGLSVDQAYRELQKHLPKVKKSTKKTANASVQKDKTEGKETSD